MRRRIRLGVSYVCWSTDLRFRRAVRACDHEGALPRLGRIDDDRQVGQRGLHAALDCAGAGLEAPSRGTAQQALTVRTPQSERWAMPNRTVLHEANQLPVLLLALAQCLP